MQQRIHHKLQCAGELGGGGGGGMGGMASSEQLKRAASAQGFKASHSDYEVSE